MAGFTAADRDLVDEVVHEARETVVPNVVPPPAEVVEGQPDPDDSDGSLDFLFEVHHPPRARRISRGRSSRFRGRGQRRPIPRGRGRVAQGIQSLTRGLRHSWGRGRVLGRGSSRAVSGGSHRGTPRVVPPGTNRRNMGLASDSRGEGTRSEEPSSRRVTRAMSRYEIVVRTHK